MANIMRFYPGGNTGNGFVSFYNNIALGDDERMIILKGGPGVGKSSFMKKLGKHFFDKGYNIEYFNCSSDNSSVDGVRIPNLNVSVIDGTSPHVVDPKYPIAVDEIVNLGRYVNVPKMRENKYEIIRITKEISAIYKCVYAFLRSAKEMYHSGISIYECAKDKKIERKLSEFISNNIFKDKVAEEKYERREMFLSAITPLGVVNMAEENARDNIIYIKSPFFAQNGIVENIKYEAEKRNENVWVFHNLIDPKMISHLYLKQRDLWIISADENSRCKESCRVFDAEEIYIKKFILNDSDKLFDIGKNFKMLMEDAIKHISLAKKRHDELEKFYIPNVDFEKIDECFEVTKNKILNL